MGFCRLSVGNLIISTGLQVFDCPSVLGTGERSVVSIRIDVSSVNSRQNMVLYTLIIIGRLLFNCSSEGGLLCVRD